MLWCGRCFVIMLTGGSISHRVSLGGLHAGRKPDTGVCTSRTLEGGGSSMEVSKCLKRYTCVILGVC